MISLIAAFEMDRRLVIFIVLSPFILDLPVRLVDFFINHLLMSLRVFQFRD